MFLEEVVHSDPLRRLTLPEDVVTEEILPTIEGLQFGEVTITVREGRIVQIERIARKRQFQFKRSPQTM